MHKFEHLIKKPTQESPPDPDVTPWAAMEVFVNDFIVLCQDVPRIDQLTRSILQCVEQVFPTPAFTNHVGGREPLSEKKIRKGEADWMTRKEVLGWLVDGDARIVNLPANLGNCWQAQVCCTVPPSRSLTDDALQHGAARRPEGDWTRQEG